MGKNTPPSIWKQFSEMKYLWFIIIVLAYIKVYFFRYRSRKVYLFIVKGEKDVWITRLATYSVDNGVNYIFINALSGSFYNGCFFCYQATKCSTVSFVRFYSPLHINRELNTLNCDLKLKLPLSRNYKIKPKLWILTKDSSNSTLGKYVPVVLLLVFGIKMDVET